MPSEISIPLHDVRNTKDVKVTELLKTASSAPFLDLPSFAIASGSPSFSDS